MNVRIIPRLDIKGPNLVKGVHLEGLRVLGKPWTFAKHYYEQGADELIYIDVVASLYGRNSLLHFVEQTSREIFIPITVGGGLRSIEDIRAALKAGADKVALNTAAIKSPELIREAANRFGSSTIVVAIEAQRLSKGKYEAYIDSGREPTGQDVFDWAQKVVELGAGEILLTCINQEGTGNGYDLELTRRVAQAVPIPVIASGGAGSLEHAYEAVNRGSADAVSMASMLHYNFLGQCKACEEDFRDEGNIVFLKSGQTEYRAGNANLKEIKDHLRAQGINCREAREGCSLGLDRQELRGGQ